MNAAPRTGLVSRIDAVLAQMAEYPLNDDIYGHFLGGDPRQFRPDEECCTPEELVAHKAACEAWDAGNEIDYDGETSRWEGGEEYFAPTSCGFATGRWETTAVIHYTQSPFGVGTQHYGIYDDLEPLLKELREALA